MEKLEEFRNCNLIDDEAYKKIHRRFIENKNISHFDVAPGFYVYKRWDLDEIIQWENEEKLEKQIIGEINSALNTWKEQL